MSASTALGDNISRSQHPQQIRLQRLDCMPAKHDFSSSVSAALTVVMTAAISVGVHAGGIRLLLTIQKKTLGALTLVLLFCARV